ADNLVGVDWIMVHQPVKQRASGHEAAGEGTAGLHIPLARVEASDSPQDHLLVLPPGNPVRRPGKGEGLPLRLWHWRGRGRPRHTQAQEEQQSNEEHSLDLAYPATCHACTSLRSLPVVRRQGARPANAVPDMQMRVRLSGRQRCCHKPPTAMTGGIITYAPYPVNAALNRRAPCLRYLLARERGVGVPPDMLKLFHNLF